MAYRRTGGASSMELWGRYGKSVEKAQLPRALQNALSRASATRRCTGGSRGRPSSASSSNGHPGWTLFWLDQRALTLRAHGCCQPGGLVFTRDVSHRRMQDFEEAASRSCPRMVGGRREAAIGADRLDQRTL